MNNQPKLTSALSAAYDLLLGAGQHREALAVRGAYLLITGKPADNTLKYFDLDGIKIPDEQEFRRLTVRLHDLASAFTNCGPVGAGKAEAACQAAPTAPTPEYMAPKPQKFIWGECACSVVSGEMLKRKAETPLGDRTWHDGPPPSVGWWPTVMVPGQGVLLRWWNGAAWSMGYPQDYKAGPHLDDAATGYFLPSSFTYRIQWQHRPSTWPAQSFT